MGNKGKKTVLAIVSAMQVEIDYVYEYLQERTGWKKNDDNIYENDKKNLRIVAKVFGIGKVNAAFGTADLINEEAPEMIVNVGYAGGLLKGSKKGDVAIGTDYVQVDLNPFFNENLPYIAPSPENVVKALLKEARVSGITVYKGRIATGDFFLHSSDKKKEIVTKYSPIAFDMESAAVAQVASVKGVPFIALRTFSDLADDNAAYQALLNRSEREKGCSIPIERRPVILAINTFEKDPDLIPAI